MSPALSIHNALDALKADSVQLGNRFWSSTNGSRSVKSANLKHLFLGKFVLGMFDSSWSFGNYSQRMFRPFRLTTLGNLVSHVVRVVAKEKVIRVATKSVVAFVKDLNPFGNLPIANGKSKSVTVPRFSGKRKSAIPTTNGASNPVPTGIWTSRFINLAPKRSFDLWRYFNQFIHNHAQPVAYSASWVNN